MTTHGDNWLWTLLSVVRRIGWKLCQGGCAPLSDFDNPEKTRLWGTGAVGVCDLKHPGGFQKRAGQQGMRDGKPQLREMNNQPALIPRDADERAPKKK